MSSYKLKIIRSIKMKLSVYLIPSLFLLIRGREIKAPLSEFEPGKQNVMFQFCEATSGCFWWKEPNGEECPSFRENVPPLKENPNLNWQTKTKQIGTWIYYAKENFNVEVSSNKSIDTAEFKVCHSILESDCQLNDFEVHSFRYAAVKTAAEDPVITIFYGINFSGEKQVISPTNEEKLILPSSFILTGKSEWTLNLHDKGNTTRSTCIQSNVPHGPGLMTNLENDLEELLREDKKLISFSIGCSSTSEVLTLPSLISSQ